MSHWRLAQKWKITATEVYLMILPIKHLTQANPFSCKGIQCQINSRGKEKCILDRDSFSTPRKESQPLT